MPHKWHIDPRGFCHLGWNFYYASVSQQILAKSLTLWPGPAYWEPFCLAFHGAGQPLPTVRTPGQLLPHAGVSVQPLSIQASLCLQPFCQQLT